MKPLRSLLALTILILVACAAPPPPAPTATPRATPGAPPAGALRPTPAPLPTLPPPSPTAPLAAAVAPRDPLFDPRRLSYAHNFNGPEIQALLEARGSALKDARFQVGDRSHSFTDVLVGLSSLYSLNPQLLLALIDLQSGLVSSGTAAPEQLAWALGYRGDGGSRRGLYSQLRWAARELRWAIRDYALKGDGPPPALTFADGSRQDVAPDLPFSRYVLARVLAPTVMPGGLGGRLDGLVANYTRLFDDPRESPVAWPAPAAPFLSRPMERNFPVTSFFDHDAPFLRENGSLLTYWGRAETDLAFAYDGHTGWDYSMGPPDHVLAAADGVVTFAGNSDDGCASPARAVIIDHGNGYRTLYWHLQSVVVAAGQPVARGAVLGVAGESGCAVGAHLHFQVQYLGRDVDPYGWCGATPDPWERSPAGQVSVWLWQDAPTPCGPPPPEIVVVDDGGPGFLSTGTWEVHEVGYGGGSRFAASSFAGSTARPWLAATLRAPIVAAWRPPLPRPGQYRVLAYLPYALNGLDESKELRYLVRHRDGESLVVADAERERNWWVDLGTYAFAPGTALVSISTLAGDDQRGVWVDAVAFVPVADAGPYSLDPGQLHAKAPPIGAGRVELPRSEGRRPEL
ncbi:MAG: peptidoglycan DD-metalloendopeptidase family protein [Chloroflexi bacterium]|nr:peptidoglycan DD-metalloendopeptidase family protein [Chloroflexota bacterium]